MLVRYNMIKFGNKVVTYNNKWAKYDGVPPEPSLPPYTIRLKYRQGTTPTFSKGTGVLVDAEQNIWDLTYENPIWMSLLQSHADLIEVIEANTSDVTDMRGMFSNCSSLTNVPLFDTSKVTNMRNTFYFCRNVQSGALALYQQASTQANPPSNHSWTFRHCGSATTTGAAELEQIPSDWK